MATNKKLIPLLEKDIGELSFGNFLRATRDAMGASQVEMARRLNISSGTLCDMEKGRQLVSVSLAVKIAKVAGISQSIAVKSCLQDQLRKANIKMKIAVGE